WLVRIIGEYPRVSQVYRHAAVDVRFFACALVEQRHELPARFRWVAADELRQYAFPSANAELLELLAHKSNT
ncbi:MAG: hypothetical protein HY288_13570, partial [Planctomycetia bacterium]|nr:hypothetical protein [Planctomycetia bacterium]